jgi:hypothetical protein
MNVLYYGRQNLTTVGTLTNVVTAKTAMNVGAIVGGVIGGVVGLCLLLTVIVTLVLILRRKRVNTIIHEEPEYHDSGKGIAESLIQLAPERVDIERQVIRQAEVVEEKSVEQELVTK